MRWGRCRLGLFGDGMVGDRTAFQQRLNVVLAISPRISVGFFRHFKGGNGCGYFRMAGEPVGVGPRVYHLLGMGVGIAQFHHIIESIVDQQSLAEGSGGSASDILRVRLETSISDWTL